MSEGAHVSLATKEGGTLTAIPVPACIRPTIRLGDAVLEVIGVGKVIKPKLDVGFGEPRHCKQCHHN